MHQNYPIIQYNQSAVFLKEPIEKRWYLARQFTSLVSVTFFTKRERGDGGNSRLVIRTFSQNDKKLILQEVIIFCKISLLLPLSEKSSYSQSSVFSVIALQTTRFLSSFVYTANQTILIICFTCLYLIQANAAIHVNEYKKITYQFNISKITTCLALPIKPARRTVCGSQGTY